MTARPRQGAASLSPVSSVCLPRTHQTPPLSRLRSICMILLSNSTGLTPTIYYRGPKIKITSLRSMPVSLLSRHPAWNGTDAATVKYKSHLMCIFSTLSNSGSTALIRHIVLISYAHSALSATYAISCSRPGTQGQLSPNLTQQPRVGIEVPREAEQLAVYV